MAVKNRIRKKPLAFSGQIPIAVYAYRPVFQMFRLAASIRPYWNFILTRLQLGPQSGRVSSASKQWHAELDQVEQNNVVYPWV